VLWEDRERRAILSADPLSWVHVGWLARRFTEEGAKIPGNGTAAWYVGRDHKGTIVKSPAGGTRLPFERILAILGVELKLQPL
jgi:hypothetical protein